MDKTAINGKDYVGGEGEIEFKHGETQRTLNIAIIDDMVILFYYWMTLYNTNL